MKFLKLILLLFLTISLNAQESRFKEGETLNVWAQSGLNMRDKPDAKAPKLTTIPYGAKVIVQPNIGVKIPFEVEEFKGFMVKGYWLLVKYADTEGFVFDGFLSRLPAPTKRDTTIEAYLNGKLKKVGEQFNCYAYGETDAGKPMKNCNDTTVNICRHSQKYGQGIIYTHVSCDEISGRAIVELPANFTFYEAFALLKWRIGSEKGKFKINATKTRIGFESSEEEYYCNYWVEIKDGKIILHEWCSC